jgi:hypothetical protein
MFRYVLLDQVHTANTLVHGQWIHSLVLVFEGNVDLQVSHFLIQFQRELLVESLHQFDEVEGLEC